MDDGFFYEDGAARILRLIHDTFGDDFKGYFNGEAEPSENYLPCVMVTTLQASIDSDATGTDEISETVTIILSRNMKDDLGASPDTNTTDYTLRHQVMGQYPESHALERQYVEKSVMHALRTHFTLNNAALQNAVSIDFQPNIRGVLPVKEAYITLNLKRLAMVPVRD